MIVAGGIATAADVRTALKSGAAGVAAGTRFLLSDESAAHVDYKRRVMEADRTIVTELFGFGWQSARPDPAVRTVSPARAMARLLARGGTHLVILIGRAAADP